MFLVLLILPTVLAWGPRNHNLILDKVCAEFEDDEILDMCCNDPTNQASLRAGAEIPDITVIYYYVAGGKNYKLTHNWNFQQEVLSRATTEDEKCFAYGIAFHLIADSLVHTKTIPEIITSTKIPNWLSHPLSEKKWDSQSLRKNPILLDETKNMMNSMYGDKGNKYIEMMGFSLGENVDFDIREQTDNLAFALDSFYEDAYRPQTKDNSIFAIYPLVDSLTNFLQPVIGWVNQRQLDANVDKAVELTINTFNNWGTRNSLSPHGFSELQQADKGASFIVSAIFILLIFLSVGIPILLIWLTKKFYWAFLFLLIFPIIFIAVTIIYTIL